MGPNRSLRFVPLALIRTMKRKGRPGGTPFTIPSGVKIRFPVICFAIHLSPTGVSRRGRREATLTR